MDSTDNKMLTDIERKILQVIRALVLVKTEDPVKRTTTRYDSASAQAESDLLRELVEPSSSVYSAIKDIIIREYEIQDKYDTGPNAREKAAEKAILNFVTKAHDYLRMGENLDKKFKTGMNKLILVNGNMLMANLKGKTA